MRCKDLLAGSFRNAMRKRKFELLGEELLDIRALYVVCLVDLHYFEDLVKS